MEKAEPFVLRVLDVAAASIGLVVTAPVLLVLVVLIPLSSPGPAIFSQIRVGQGERRFTCYKLRTMRSGTRSAGTHEITRESVTGLGAFLRSSKIDELPQLWNVLRGEMSLVGPRPCLPEQIDVIEARRALGVYRLRPGITGPAQIAGVDMSTPLKLAEHDCALFSDGGVGRYLALLVLTLVGRGQGDRIA